MTRLEVRLLGEPAVAVDGEPVPNPRGAKPWALLAYIALSERSWTRSHLAELLFGQADDPLGALRWNLAALRRVLCCPDALKGGLLHLDLPSDAVIDTAAVLAGDLTAVDRFAVDEELLAGCGFDHSPGFESWLVSERRLLRNRGAGLLREATVIALAEEDFDRGIDLASRLVAVDEFDEGHHALLMRGLALSGDAAGASDQLEVCRRALRPLGVEPGPAVRSAAAGARSATAGRAVAPETVDAQLAVLWQSFLAGSVDDAIEGCRAVVADAEASVAGGTVEVARLYLASMLAMTIRSWDEAGVTAMRVARTAESGGDTTTQATALGILAGIEMMRADYSPAQRHASLGLEVTDAPGARCLNLMFRAATQADLGEFPDATENAAESVLEAERSGDRLFLVYALSHQARAWLLQDLPEAAADLVDRALGITGGAMLTVEPWPETMCAEIDLADGRLDTAMARAEHALAVATTTRVNYQQALAMRVLGLVAARRGDIDRAESMLTDALQRARRTTGEGYMFHWPVAIVLDSLATVSSDPVARQQHARTLLEHATDHGMAGFVERAGRHLAVSE